LVASVAAIGSLLLGILLVAIVAELASAFPALMK
jgi:hypothetical protein